MQPKYNIQLKDDKSYPWIIITKEYFPKVILTRKKTDAAEYFGPYPNLKSAKALLGIIKERYPMRTCSCQLSIETLTKGSYKRCLEFQLSQSQGHFANPHENQEKELEDIRQILKGNITTTIRTLRLELKELIKNLEFEKARMVSSKDSIIGQL